MDRYDRVRQLLQAIEDALRAQNDWSSIRPRPEQLASDQPFCVDTLSFPEWLQFLLLPRLWALVEGHHDLPAVSGIAPMAELYFAGKAGADRLVDLLRTLDQVLAGN